MTAFVRVPKEAAISTPHCELCEEREGQWLSVSSLKASAGSAHSLVSMWHML